MPRLVTIVAAGMLVTGIGVSLPHGASAAGSSLVLGIQDRRLDIDLGIDGVAPVSNTQTSVRSALAWDVSESWSFLAQASGASSWLELNDTRLTGLTDVKLRALYRPDDAWAFGVGTVVPFGLYNLTAAEVTTAQWAWIPRSGFPVTRFGEGWGWEGTAARAFHAGDRLTLGIAGAYLRHAEFSLIEDGAAEYRLGDEIGLSIGADWDLDGDRSFGVDAAVRFFGTDQLDGEDIVAQGNQMDLGLRFASPIGAFTTSWGVHGSFKGDNEIFDPAADEPLPGGPGPGGPGGPGGAGGADSLGAASQAPGLFLSGEGRIGRSIARNLALFVEGSVLRISDSDYLGGTADGTTWAVGPALAWRVAPEFAFGFRYQLVRGSGHGGLTLDGHDVLVTMEIRR